MKMTPQEKLSALEVIAALWPIFLSLAGLVFSALVWFIRLEQRQKNTQRELDEHKLFTKESIAAQKENFDKNNKAIWDKIEAFGNKFDRLFEGLGEIKGMLNRKD